MLRPREVVVGVALAVCLGITLANMAKHNDILNHLEEQQREEMATMRLSSTWTSEQVAHTLTSTPREGETVEAWALRHKAAVDAAKAVFPPDPPTE